MTNKALAFFAFLTLCGFLGILIYKVPRLDLGIVIAITLLLAGYDFFFHRESKDR